MAVSLTVRRTRGSSAESPNLRAKLGAGARSLLLQVTHAAVGEQVLIKPSECCGLPPLRLHCPNVSSDSAALSDESSDSRASTCWPILLLNFVPNSFKLNPHESFYTHTQYPYHSHTRYHIYMSPTMCHTHSISPQHISYVRPLHHNAHPNHSPLFSGYARSSTPSPGLCPW